MECQSDDRGGHHRHSVARIPLLRFHRLLLWMLVYYDVREDGWYRRRARVLGSFRSCVRDRLPRSKRGPVGSAIRPDPQRLRRVSSMKSWFVSDRKNSEASTAAAPTNDTNGLVRKTTSVSSFHSAPSELGIGPGPSATTESFALPPLN